MRLHSILSPRLLAWLVALLLLGSVAALPVVDDGDGVARIEAVAGASTNDDGTESTTSVPTSVVDVDTGDIPRQRLPRLPVTVPTVTVPTLPVETTLPSITLPPVVEDAAQVACRAAAEAPAVGGSALGEEGTYTAAPDGRDVRRIARSYDPGTWDGAHRRVAYQAVIDPTANALCVMEGGAVRAIGTVRPFGGFAAPGATQVWASNDRVVAVNDGGAAPAIQLFDARNGGMMRDLAGVVPHDVSPDGRRLAFVSGDAPNQVMNVADLDTGTVRQLARLDRDTTTGFFLRWLPDGSGIAYLTRGIHVIDADDGTRRTLRADNADHVGGTGGYAFAPDGRVAYSTYLGGDDGRLFVADADGSDPVQVAEGPISSVAWSPSGDRLLFAEGRGNEASLQSMRVDGTDRRTLLRAAARPGEHWLRFVLNNAWTPDGSRIAFGLWRDRAADSVA